MKILPTASEALGKIAAELECGCNDPWFFDPRGGFQTTLAWHRSALNFGYWPEHKEYMSMLLQECFDFLSATESDGWNRTNLEKAHAIAEKIRQHSARAALTTHSTGTG